MDSISPQFASKLKPDMWNSKHSQVHSGGLRGPTRDEHMEEDDDLESKTESEKPFGQVRKLDLKPRIKREVPVLRYPVVKLKTNLLEKFGLTNFPEGRQILLPSKKRVKMQPLVPLHLMAASKDFKALQESEEWKRMREAMKARSEGSTERFAVTEEFEVRCGAYQLCTKCANIRKLPVKISTIYKSDKDKQMSGIYDTWANSLKELNPYLERRNKVTKKKQKELEKKQEAEVAPAPPPPPDPTSINFDDVYSFLNEAMNKIETSSEKTKRRIQSGKGSSEKFVKGSGAAATAETIEEKPEPSSEDVTEKE